MALPPFFKPMLLSEQHRPFHKAGWVFEEKIDGYRVLAWKESGRVRLISRNLKDLTKNFPLVVQDLQKLPPTLILDGEIASFDHQHNTHLGYLRSPLAKEAREHGLVTPPIFVAFDLLYLGRKNLCPLPLKARRNALEALLRGYKRPSLLLVRRLEKNGLTAWETVKKRQLEGMVAKDETSPYVPGVRTGSWIKIKHRIRQGWPEEGLEWRRG